MREEIILFAIFTRVNYNNMRHLQIVGPVYRSEIKLIVIKCEIN
jgi:hypothetical protein